MARRLGDYRSLLLRPYNDSMSVTVNPALHAIGWKPPPQPLPDDLPEGARVVRVVAQHRAGYEVHDGERQFPAQPAVRFLRPGVPGAKRPVVGDFVVITDQQPVQIERILPRRNELARAAAGERHQRQILATNIDTALIVMGLDGDFNIARAERYLMLIADSGAAAVIVLTKADLVEDAQPQLQALRKRVPAHVPILVVNATTMVDLEPLAALLQRGDSAVLVGSSGAGKSTVTNSLLGEQLQQTGAVRVRDSRGRHTTRHREMVRLPGGACLIDSPGMRELKLTGEEKLPPDQFADIVTLAARCRFQDCAHLREPDCAVQEALVSGDLAPARWANYLKLRGELAVAHQAGVVRDRNATRGRRR